MNFKLPSGIFISKTNSESVTTYFHNFYHKSITSDEIDTVNYCNLYIKNATNFEKSQTNHEIVSSNILLREVLIADNFYDFKDIQDNFYNILSEGKFKIAFDRVRNIDFSFSSVNDFKLDMIDDFISKNNQNIITKELVDFDDLNNIKFHIIEKNPTIDGTDGYKVCILHIINSKVPVDGILGSIFYKKISNWKIMGIHMRIFPN